MLAIITVIYKNYEIFHEFVASLTAQSSQEYKVYVLDLTEEKDRTTLVFQDNRYHLQTGPNRGYAYGVNQGVALAIKDGLTAFAVVNPDVILDSEFVASSLNALSQHPNSLIGGKIYYAPGYEYHQDKVPTNSFKLPKDGSCFPLPAGYPYSIWYAGGHIDWAHAITRHIGVDDLDHPMYDEPGSTDFVSGCCMLYDKQVAEKVGTWDEGYFMYYEDSDYCVRAQKNDIEVRYEPTIKLWHKNAQSTGGSGSDFHVKMMNKSRFRFAMKHAPWRTKLHILKNSLFPNK
ncbi:MAG: glycosyltransferase family 2 protein [bacterium]